MTKLDPFKKSKKKALDLLIEENGDYIKYCVDAYSGTEIQTYYDGMRVEIHFRNNPEIHGLLKYNEANDTLRIGSIEPITLFLELPESESMYSHHFVRLDQ